MNRVIRILVANGPKLMREAIVTTLAGQSDMEVVGELGAESEILDVLERTNPDFLIVSLDASNKRPEICDQALQKHPNLRVVALAADRDTIIYYWLFPEIRSNCVRASEESMLSALRGKAGQVLA